MNALEQAELYYEQALALARDPELQLRYRRVRFLHDEEDADELAAARDGLIAAGDPAAAAEASLMLANISWKAGRSDDMLRNLERARSLVADRPPSRAQASVLTEGARYAMLAEDSERAIELGLEAIRLADELGLDDLRASALNSVGVALTHGGRSRLRRSRGEHRHRDSSEFTHRCAQGIQQRRRNALRARRPRTVADHLE